MLMPIVRGETKIAVLLTSLPHTTAESVLVRLGPERGRRLRGLMEQVRAEVPREAADEILREFGEALFQATRPRPRLAVDTVPDADTYESSQRPSSARSAPRAGEPGAAPGGPPRPADGAPPVNEAIARLRSTDNDRLSAALKGEHPHGVATVLSCLEPGSAFEVLKRLPPEVRKDVFPRLGQATGGADEVSLRIVRAVVAKSQAIAAAPTQANGDSKAQMMAEILRSMERGDRMDLMEALKQRDQALADVVSERLYVFDDLTVIEGQSMQKLLAEIDSKTLAVALKDASDDIIDNVMDNLSRRARESLDEEMSFLGTVSELQVQEARKSVVDVIRRMDQAGELG